MPIVLTNPCCCNTVPPCPYTCANPDTVTQFTCTQPPATRVAADIYANPMVITATITYPSYDSSGVFTENISTSMSLPFSGITYPIEVFPFGNTNGEISLTVQFTVEGSDILGDMRISGMMVSFHDGTPPGSYIAGWSDAEHDTSVFDQTTGYFSGFTKSYDLAPPPTGYPGTTSVTLTCPATTAPKLTHFGRCDLTAPGSSWVLTGEDHSDEQFLVKPSDGEIYQVITPEYYNGSYNRNNFALPWTGGTLNEASDITAFNQYWKGTVTSTDPCNIGGEFVYYVGHVDPRIVYPPGSHVTTVEKCCKKAGVAQVQPGTIASWEQFTGSFTPQVSIYLGSFAPDYVVIYEAYPVSDPDFLGTPYFFHVTGLSWLPYEKLEEGDYIIWEGVVMRVKGPVCCDDSRLVCTSEAFPYDPYVTLVPCVEGVPVPSGSFRILNPSGVYEGAVILKDFGEGENCYTVTAGGSENENDLTDFTLAEEGCADSICPRKYQFDECVSVTTKIFTSNSLFDPMDVIVADLGDGVKCYAFVEENPAGAVNCTLGDFSMAPEWCDDPACPRMLTLTPCEGEEDTTVRYVWAIDPTLPNDFMEPNVILTTFPGGSPTKYVITYIDADPVDGELPPWTLSSCGGGENTPYCILMSLCGSPQTTQTICAYGPPPVGSVWADYLDNSWTITSVTETTLVGFLGDECASCPGSPITNWDNAVDAGLFFPLPGGCP